MQFGKQINYVILNLPSSYLSEVRVSDGIWLKLLNIGPNSSRNRKVPPTCRKSFYSTCHREIDVLAGPTTLGKASRVTFVFAMNHEANIFVPARLTLNFKGIDYKTEWVEYPDIAEKFKSLSVSTSSYNSTLCITPCI